MLKGVWWPLDAVHKKEMMNCRLQRLLLLSDSGRSILLAVCLTGVLTGHATISRVTAPRLPGIFDWYVKDTAALPGPAPSAFIEAGGGLPHFTRLIKAHKAVKVAFLGGSITHMKGWRDKVMNYLRTTYPESAFQFLDAGIPSLGSVPHAFRLKHDVLDKMKPDLMLIESAVNDEGNGTTATEQRRALEGIVRQAHRACPEMDMVLMAFADEVKNQSYREGKVPLPVSIHQQIAAYYRLPFINLALEVYRGISRGLFSWEKDFHSLHPAPFGQELYFQAIKTLLEQQIATAETEVAATRSGSWPPPMQALNYSHGHYVDIHEATDLKGFHITEDWTPADQKHTRPGFVHVPALCGSRPGDQLSFRFRGSAVGIAVLSGPDAGCIRYSVDGGAEKLMDLYTRWSSHLHLPWYEMLAGGLRDKGRRKGKSEDSNRRQSHVLKLVIAPRAHGEETSGHPDSAQDGGTAAAGTAVRIVRFLVN